MTLSLSGFRASSRNPYHILIVEDNAINQKVMATQLRKLGCTVNIASNGLEALEYVQNQASDRTAGLSSNTPQAQMQSPRPLSLILMDIEMPVMDGLTCTERIRALEQAGQIGWHIPIVAITANARNEQVTRAKTSGIDIVITKPFRIPELMPVMKTLVASYPSPHAAKAAHTVR